jgi:hypothetical protein
VLAAKVERLAIAYGLESGCFVHGHAADGVFGRGFRCIHGHVPFLLLLSFDFDFSGVWNTHARGVASRRGQVAPLTPARDGTHRHAFPLSTIFIKRLEQR